MAFIFQGFPKTFTPLEASRVLSRAESQMCPAHDTAFAAGIDSCKQETCCHFIQPTDMTGGRLRHILVPSDYDVLIPVSLIFSCSFFFVSVLNYTCFSSFALDFPILLQENLSKTEISAKLETALQFPTAADLKDLQDIEGKFSGESLFMDLHLFFMLPHLHPYNIVF